MVWKRLKSEAMATDLVCKIDKEVVSLTDHRVNCGTNHDLVEMIFMALTATLCGAQGWVDIERFAMAKFEWFERFIPLEKGIPGHDTIGRVFARLDTAEFFTAMHGWVDEFASCLWGQDVAIDGKVVRGSHDTQAGQSPLSLVTAYATSASSTSAATGRLRTASILCWMSPSQKMPATSAKARPPEISSAIRRMALIILQHDSMVKDNIRGKRLRAGWDEQVHERV